MRKPLILLLLFCAGLTSVNAQQDNFFEGGGNKPKFLFSPAVSAHLGTQGVGLELSVPAMKRLNFRLGGSFLPLKYTTRGFFDGVDTRIDMDARFNNVHALADIQLFDKSNSLFRKIVFSVGAGYFYKAHGDFQLQPTDDFYYGDIIFTGNDLGELNVDISWKGFAPYAGFGLNDIKLTDRFNMNLGVGTYQFKSPSVKLSGNKMISSKASNETQLAQNMSNYRWLPVLQLGFNYNLVLNKSKNEE